MQTSSNASTTVHLISAEEGEDLTATLKQVQEELKYSADPSVPRPCYFRLDPPIGHFALGEHKEANVMAMIRRTQEYLDEKQGKINRIATSLVSSHTSTVTDTPTPGSAYVILGSALLLSKGPSCKPTGYDAFAMLPVCLAVVDFRRSSPRCGLPRANRHKGKYGGADRSSPSCWRRRAAS